MKNPASAPNKSPLKWVGGKYRALPYLLKQLAATPNLRLIEPFVGGGSVFLNAPQKELLLNDANPDLVAFYVALKERPDEYISEAKKLFVGFNNAPERFKQLRTVFNASYDRFERSVLLLYLNRFCFNGLYRTNRAGEFNVPFGKPVRTPAFPESRLWHVAERMASATITAGGFSGVMAMAGAGDVVYCDPPYIDDATKPSFVSYTPNRFGFEEQELLVLSAKAAVGRGAIVLISNHDTERARELYKGFSIESYEVSRTVAAKAERRGAERELLARLPCG